MEIFSADDFINQTYFGGEVEAQLNPIPDIEAQMSFAEGIQSQL